MWNKKYLKKKTQKKLSWLDTKYTCAVSILYNMQKWLLMSVVVDDKMEVETSAYSWTFYKIISDKQKLPSMTATKIIYKCS